jgi:hypothetical protein
MRTVSVIELTELLENLLRAAVRYALAGVPNLDPHPPAAPATAEENPPGRRVAYGVAEEIAKYATEQRRIGPNHVVCEGIEA